MNYENLLYEITQLSISDLIKELLFLIENSN